MSEAHRNNHYVPQWYQRRFIPADATERVLFYLDLKRDQSHGSKRRTTRDERVHRTGPRYCFVERDLYTNFLGDSLSTDLERVFFGKIDEKGKRAVEIFSDYSISAFNSNTFQDMLSYMGTQKLRTPKGLGWIAAGAQTIGRNQILQLMASNRSMYAAVWSECVWLIADAERCETKFILSDHPVTVYNRHCGPRSHWCRGFNDPDVRFAATQTIFPLSLKKVLLLTNLTWARNPYQDPVAFRPNPSLTRRGYFHAMEVQTERHLSEREVREINFIVKSRALRYVAAGRQDWLYPERQISKSDWAAYGNGYLLMPDPRALSMGGTIYAGFDDGRFDASDEYGRKSWQSDFQKQGSVNEDAALYRFQGEFARLNGPERRGRTQLPGIGLESETDSDELHAYHLSLEEPNRRLMRGQRHW